MPNSNNSISRACVSTGLVYKEIQNLARGIVRSDVEMLCNPRSYGVEIVEKYDHKVHDKAQVFFRPQNKKPYVRAVRWIIEAVGLHLYETRRLGC